MKLFRWIAWGEWRAQPVRTLLATGAIAIGVALGLAVHLVNEAALDRFAAALNETRGSADLQIIASSPSGFEEELFGRLVEPDGPVARLGRAVLAVSPVVERDVPLAGRGDIVLRVSGVDALRALQVTPGVVGQPYRAVDEDDASPTRTLDWLDPDGINLPTRLMDELEKRIGDTIDVDVDGKPVRLRIVGRMINADEATTSATPTGFSDRRFRASMDIAGAQWRLDRLGRLTRIDVRLAPGASVAAARETLAAVLPAGVRIVSGADDRARSDDLSRAYRVNLDMLALMALFTGAFLVYSTQSLAVARRRAHLALLRVIGVKRWRVIAQVVGEGCLLGVVGGLVGLALGVAVASTAVRWFGGDLGGGFFPKQAQLGLPALWLAAPAAAAFFALGLAAALVGSFLPARDAVREEPARALRASGRDPRRALPRPWLALVFLVAGCLLTQVPSIEGLPLAGYAAMACLLFGGIAAMPWLARRALAPLAWGRHLRAISSELAVRRLWAAPSAASTALCGLVASASLMVAMTVMIGSFRGSVDAWLGQVLSADVYVRTNAIGDAGLTPTDALRLSTLDGVRRLDLQKVVPLSLSPARPSVSLVVRTVDEDPRRSLPLVSNRFVPESEGIPVWVSEAMVDLYGMKPGDRVELPLSAVRAGRAAAGPPLIVAGVWRDYARQSGSIVMRRDDYTRITGDDRFPDAAISVALDDEVDNVVERVRGELPEALRSRADFLLPGAIRSLSLSIFDRSFAIAYVLQAVAIVIGLAGVAATFSAQTLARAKEFGMLRHIGVTRLQVLGQIGIEGALLGFFGAVAGSLIGLALSQVLIHVVNPQSFHWTMETRIAPAPLAAIAVALVVASTATALLSGRRATSRAAVLAVREDW